MSEDFSSRENELRKNIEIMDNTFAKFNLKVLNVGVEYATMVGGKGIRFYCEIMADDDLNPDIDLIIKINVYSQEGNLISMGEEPLSGEYFIGYDTLQIAVFHDSIHDEAAKARIFLTKKPSQKKH